MARLYETERHTRSWGSAFFSASAFYVALTGAAATLGTPGGKKAVSEEPMQITFVDKVAKPEEPPPAPDVVKESHPAPAAAPVVPAEMQVRQLDKVPPRKPLVAPKEMPNDVPQEVDPNLDKGIAMYGAPGDGDPAGLEGGTAQGGVAGGEVGVIWLPDDAAPPIPSRTNTEPEYPHRARAAGKTGVVILKVAILANGSVKDIEVVGGEEPFTSAAMTAVRGWTYEPARYKGQPISVYRTIRVKFEMNK